MPKPDNVGVGVAVIVEHAINKRILLLMRQGAHAAGTYAVPGGWIDAEDEDPKETCIRELREEVGIHIGLDQLWLFTAVSEWHEDLKMRTVTLYYVVSYDPNKRGEPIIMEHDKCSELVWTPPQHPLIADWPLFPKLDGVLKMLCVS